MKASKKILLTAVCLVIAGVITGLIVLRNHALIWLRKTEAESKFRPVSVGNFKSLDFSDNWVVDIRQGNEYKVELAVDDNAMLKPTLENVDGTLYFKADTAITGSIQAKVEVQSLLAIKAMRGTKIHLRDFQSDSISLILENGSVFTGYNNHFKYMSFKTAGDVSLLLTDDEL